MRVETTRSVASRKTSPERVRHASPLEFLARHNALYILSALLMLVGCLLISLPRPFRLVDLVILLLVINVYEAMVIAAIAWIAGRAPASRETNVLLIIETAFLLDVHFTVNACVTADALWGPMIAAASLALAFAKAYAIARLSGGGVFGGLKRVLLPAIVFAHAFQVVLVLARTASPWAREISTYALWLALGALPLVLMLPRPGDRETGRRGDMPWWRTAGFARAVSALSLIVPLALLAGQTWAHEAPFSAAMLLPLVFSLLVAAPILLPEAGAGKIAAVRVGVTILALMIAMVTGDLAWGIADSFTLSPMRVGLVFGAAAFLVASARERRRTTWNLAFALLALAALGHDAPHIAGAAFEPGAWHAGALAALAFLWWLRGRGCERAVAASGFALFFVTLAVEGAYPRIVSPYEFVRWLSAISLALVTAYGVRERALRPALFTLVFALGAGGLFAGDAAAGAYFFAGVAALGLATLRGGRAYLIALAAYPVASAMIYWRMPLPGTSGQWGAVVIVCAFTVLAGALAVTRARMGRDGADVLAEGQVPSPARRAGPTSGVEAPGEVRPALTGVAEVGDEGGGS